MSAEPAEPTSLVKSQDASTASDASDKVVFYKNPMIMGPLVLVLLLVLVLIWWFGFRESSSENYVNRTVNMIGFRHPDPTEYKYTNREKAANGMDDNDYYLEGKMTHKYGLGPELLNDAAFQSRVIAEDTSLKEQESVQTTAW